MSAVCGDLFYLPLQTTPSVAACKSMSPRAAESGWDAELSSGFLTQFIGDSSNSALKCLVDPNSIRDEFWPLVLYGGSGHGKTSIAMAFANRLAEQGAEQRTKQKSGQLTPTFFRAGDIVRRHRDAIQTDSIDDFRRRFFSADILVIDDLNLLNGKIAVQTELVKLLDSCFTAKKPVILTVDHLPGSGEGLIPQLSSRLVGGLVLPVNRPGQAARRTIASKLAERFGIVLDSSAADFVVDHCDFPVPRMTQLFAQLKHSLGPESGDTPLSSDKIKQSLFGDNRHYDRDMQMIIRLVAAHYELEETVLKSKSRKQTTVLARNICVYLARDLLQLSFAKIGRCFGGRDHSTVIHAHKNIVSLIENDPQLLSSISELKRKLTDQFLLVVE